MKKIKSKETIFLAALIILGALVIIFRLNKSSNPLPNAASVLIKGLPAISVNGQPTASLSGVPVASDTPATAQNPVPSATPIPDTTTLAQPLSDALSRVTKKPFGLQVSPGHSPVSPEKFSGYHTGVDFETLPSEANIDVPVRAVCTGPLLMKKIATGYGGVAVQECRLDKQTVTIIYGHLRYSSITAKAGEEMAAGQSFAVLGTGYSAETAGERKHLHLGIHLGSTLNILGYVQKAADLSGWLDALQYLK